MAAPRFDDIEGEIHGTSRQASAPAPRFDDIEGDVQGAQPQPDDSGAQITGDDLKRAANWYARQLAAPVPTLAPFVPQFDVAPLEAKTPVESAAKGFEQGSSLGFEDENTGMRAAVKAILRGENPVDAYRGARDVDRASVAQAKTNDSGAYLGGDIVGSLAVPFPVKGAPTFAGRVANAALTGAQLGAAQGLGHSNADLTEGQFAPAAVDTALAGSFGAAGGALGQTIGEGVTAGRNAVVDYAKGRVASADQKLDLLAQQKLLKDMASASGELGASVQQGNRLVENLLRLEQTGALTPELKAALDKLRQSGSWDELVRGVAQNNLEELPGKLSEIEGRKAALAQLQGDRDAAFSAAREEVANPMAQIMPRVKRYAAPLAGSLFGGAAGVAAGLATGGPAAVYGLAGAGMRPALQALGRMAKHPAVERSVFGIVQRLLETNPQALGRFAAPLAKAAAEGEQALNVTHFVLAQSSPEYREQLAKLQANSDGEDASAQ